MTTRANATKAKSDDATRAAEKARVKFNVEENPADAAKELNGKLTKALGNGVAFRVEGKIRQAHHYTVQGGQPGPMGPIQPASIEVTMPKAQWGKAEKAIKELLASYPGLHVKLTLPPDERKIDLPRGWSQTRTPLVSTDEKGWIR